MGRLHRAVVLVIALTGIACASRDSAQGGATLDAGADSGARDDASIAAFDAGCPAHVASTAKAVGAGIAHTCALGTDGQVLCWGANAFGQLGTASIDETHVPRAVCGLGESVAIAVGGSHTCALSASGEVHCWGWNFLGQLGSTHAGTYSSIPVAAEGLLSDAVAIAAGVAHTCIVTHAGAVQCWGANTNGELGTGAMGEKSLPGGVVKLGSPALRVAAGEAHTCALLEDHGIACWGAGNYGQLGDGTDTGRASPAPITSAAGHEAVTAGGFFTCAVATTGAASCWGYDRLGNLGDGSTTNSFVPVAVTGLDLGVTGIAAGDGHACARMATGKVECWGFGGLGQLGNGSTSDSPVPVTVTGLDTASEIATGKNHSCAVTSAGTIACWGSNANGQLGDDTVSDRSLPVRVHGL